MSGIIFFRLCTCPPNTHEKGQNSGLTIFISIPSTLSLSIILCLGQSCELSRTHWKPPYPILFSLCPASPQPTIRFSSCMPTFSHPNQRYVPVLHTYVHGASRRRNSTPILLLQSFCCHLYSYSKVYKRGKN